MVHRTVLLLKPTVKYTAKWLLRSLQGFPKCAVSFRNFLPPWGGWRYAVIGRPPGTGHRAPGTGHRATRGRKCRADMAIPPRRVHTTRQVHQDNPVPCPYQHKPMIWKHQHNPVPCPYQHKHMICIHQHNYQSQ